MIQEPRTKPGTAIVLRGKMGAGKSKVGEVFGSLLGAHFFQIEDPRYITGQFNQHLSSCLLLQADEAVWAGDKTAEGKLKGLVTSSYHMIEAKGVDPVRLPNYVRLLMTSNENWVWPAAKDERRAAIFDINPQCAKNHEYFREMDEELASGGFERLLEDLLACDVKAVNLRQVPNTDALLTQKVHSLDPIDAWFLDRLVSGTPTRKRSEWPTFIPTEELFDDYVEASERIGVRRKSSQTAFGMRFSQIVPFARRKRQVLPIADDPTTKRVWGYEMPPLHECREAFEEAVGHDFDWGEA